MYKLKVSACLILFVCSLIVVSCSGNGKRAGKTEEKQEASLMEVSIGGMMCLGCEQTIQMNVGKLEGIRSVKASFTTGNAIIEYFPGMVDTTKVKEAIKGSGYTVQKIIALTKEEGEK